ncbi:hypothetical protein SAY86_020167 [Trapa natans]|uniref:Uncharacterized protein n=1 Tax=Trapa natans TaxID=22666 RepID=A0AAN7LIL5_TRANT|nr:hypothetical protein SAY86_020167 [Trapa natans]
MTINRSQLQADQSSRPMSMAVVLSIDCLKGSSRAEEWTGDMLQTGDIVEELRIGGSVVMRSPFKNGRSGVQKILHSSFKSNDTSIVVRVRRGSDEFAELQACIVPNEFSGKKQYMLRSIDDPNYAVGFCDRSESECLELIASRSSRMVNALSRTPLQDGYVSYRWEKKLNEHLQVPYSSCFLSILFLPKASDRSGSQYNDLEDTLARANAWLIASQEFGIPIVFMSIQTESLLTKISGERASSTVSAGSLSDLSNIASASLYGFEDYHGVDIGVVRAVRLWYAPLAGEFPIEIELKEGDLKLGFAISRSEEGFIYISSVVDGDDNAPSSRSGLRSLYMEAVSKSQRLVISRVSNQKVLPWIVSPAGAIRCYDTVSLSQKLSMHKHAKMPILIHVILWDKPIFPPNADSSSLRASPMPFPPEVNLARQPSENQVQPLPPGMSDEDLIMDNKPGQLLTRDTAGDISFRFHNFSIPSNNWV